MNFYSVTTTNTSTAIPYSGAPLFATEVNGYNPSQLLSFIDLTDSILENNLTYNEYAVLTPNSGSYPSEYILPQKFRGYGSGILLVTDRTTTSQYVDFTIPLYHQYQLEFDYYLMDPSLLGGFLLIRKNMASIISPDDYVIETRQFATSSGRYNNPTVSGFIWNTQATSGNIVTARLLIPLREKDNFYTVEYNKYLNNSITQYYDELIDEQVIYNQGVDYTITPSSILLTAGSNIGSGVTLYTQKSLTSFVEIDPPHSLIDSTMSLPWNMKISCGQLINSSGLIGGSNIYKINNYHAGVSGYGIINNEVPQFINKNVLKLGVHPLYRSASGYPLYDISSTIISGTINSNDIRSNITSIDYNFGYVYLNMDIKVTDNISFTYAYDDSKTLIGQSLDLNPKNSVSGVIDVALHSIGVALVPSGTTFHQGGSGVVNWSNVAIYKVSDNMSADFATVSTTGYALESLSSLASITGVIPGNSISLGFFTINSLPNSMVKLYDARRTGGYDASTIVNNVSGWRGFSDIGYWDGQAFPSAGTIIIQIPSVVYTNIKQVFSASGLFNVVNAPYTADLDKIIDRGTTAYDSYSQQIITATNAYIRDTIERYLPVGVLYIIVDENFNIWPSITE